MNCAILLWNIKCSQLFPIWGYCFRPSYVLDELVVGIIIYIFVVQSANNNNIGRIYTTIFSTWHHQRCIWFVKSFSKRDVLRVYDDLIIIK